MSHNDTGSPVATEERPTKVAAPETSSPATAESTEVVLDKSAKAASAETAATDEPDPAATAKSEPSAAKSEPASATAEPAPETASGESASRPGLLRRIAKPARRALFPVTAAIAVAALVAVGILGWQVKQQRDVDAASDAGLAAAKAYAVTLTSVDATKLDADFAAVLDGATGEFRDMYTRSSGQLRQLLLDNKATGKGTVLDAAVKSATETKVEVLLFIDQTVTNAASQDPRVDRSRVVMTMELVDGRWLASRVYLP